MLPMRTTPPFRADHVGSLLRPPQVLAARDDFAAGRIDAEVLTVDRFGNAQLSVTGPDAARAGLTPGAAATLTWASREQRIPFGATFGDVPAGELVCFRDSAGYIAIAVNGGNAARRLGLLAEALVTLTVTK